MDPQPIDLGRVGIWTFQLDLIPSRQSQEHMAELEELGYGAVWVPEAFGREAFVNSALLLGSPGTRRIKVATGIASIWARDAMAMSTAHKTLTEAYPDRFLLGMGVSHQPMVDFVRGHSYDKPYRAMQRYLDAMDAAPFAARAPETEPHRVLAALGPKMLELAAARREGAHPYFVPPEHTAFARQHLGSDKLLAVEQAVVLESDAEKARTIARQHTALYVTLPNYTNNLRRFGFGDEDFANGGSNRLVDAIVAWGDVGVIAERVKAHHDAGADHVCVQVIPEAATDLPADAWRTLAPALLT